MTNGLSGAGSEYRQKRHGVNPENVNLYQYVLVLVTLVVSCLLGSIV